MRPPLDREGRADLRALASWRGQPRPRVLRGLIPLGRLAVAPFLVVAATFAPRSSRASIFLDRVQVGQAILGVDGCIRPRRDLTAWLERQPAPTGALLALRRELEHRLVAELARSVWAPARAELERERRAEELAPPASTRPAGADHAAGGSS